MSQNKISKTKNYLDIDTQNKLRQQLLENSLNGKNKLAMAAVMSKFNISKATYMRYNNSVKTSITPTDDISNEICNTHDESDDYNYITFGKKSLNIPNIPSLSGKRKKFQKPKYFEVEDIIFSKFRNYRSLGYPVSGPLLRLTAKRIAKKLINTPGTPSQVIEKYSVAEFGESWLDGFKSRHNIRGNIRVNGERASLPFNIDELMAPIVDLIESSEIPIKNIYNWDETGLFYRGLPRYTLASGDDDGAGSKEDKNRITVMLSVNGDGFWKENGVDYFSNSKAWMNGQIFEKLLRDFDSRMNEPTILIIDNFAGHSVEELADYKWIIPIFLPANTTSVTQPLDGGIIATAKVKYRLKLMNYILDQVDNNVFRLNELTLHRCIPWFVEACKELSPLTIQKCFYKTLKMEMFKPADVVVLKTEMTQTMDALLNAVGQFMGREVPIIDVMEYLTKDNDIKAEIDNAESDNEQIAIPDPRTFLKQRFTIDELKNYLRETGCVREQNYLSAIIEKLECHMNNE